LEENIVGVGAEFGVGPAGVVVLGESHAAAGAGAADVPDEEHVDPVVGVRLVVRAQVDVDPDDAGRDATVGEDLVDGLHVGPVWCVAL
jgi:hypothetical protein